jgi:hypothetical protein
MGVPQRRMGSIESSTRCHVDMSILDDLGLDAFKASQELGHCDREAGQDRQIHEANPEDFAFRQV